MVRKEIEAILDGYSYTEEMVPIAEIFVDEVETGEGLRQSLVRLGHTTDVVLNKTPSLVEGKEYRVVDGRKTINGLIRKKKKRVKARVYKNLPIDVCKYILLVRNLQRSPSPVVEAEAIQELISNHNKTQKEISEITGINPSVISQRLSLLKLPKRFLEDLRSGKLTYSVAKKIGGLPLDVQNKIAKEEKITGEIVELHRRKHLDSMLSFDDIDLPKKPKGIAIVQKYQIRHGKLDKKMTRKELFSYIEDKPPGLSEEDEIIIRRI